MTEVDHYSWTFTSKIFRFALEITFLLNKYFSHKWFTSYSHKVENLISRGGGGGGGEKGGGVEKFFEKKKRGGGGGGRGRNKSGGLKNFLKKISEGAGMTLARDPRVIFL